MTADRWGLRPLTFLTRDHIEAAAELPWGCVIAERHECGRFITYRAVDFWEGMNGAVVVITGDEARKHLRCQPNPCPELVARARQAAADGVA